MGIQVGGRIFSNNHTLKLPEKSGTLATLDDIPASEVGGAGSIQYVDFQLTDAEIKDLKANPIQVLAAPGANKGYSFPLYVSYYAVIDTSNGAYETHDVGETQYASLDLFYGAAHGIALTLGSGLTVLETEDVSTVQETALQTASTLGEANPNVAVFIGNNGDIDFAGGGAGNTISFRFFYTIVNTSPFS